MRRTPFHVLALPFLAAVVLACPHARADVPLVTDRPEFVATPDVVGPGRFQVETSVESARESIGGLSLRSLDTPTLLRLGITDTVELRAQGDGLAHDRTTDTLAELRRTHGFTDVSFGAKWRVREGNAGWMPGVAWLADVDTPTGSSSFRVPGFRPSVRASAEWALPRDFTLGVMPGVFLDRNDQNKRFGAGVLAVTLGKSWSPRWRTFFEVAGERLAAGQNGGSSITFDTGASYRMTNSVQFDVAVARGLTSGSPDLRAGLGLAMRF